MSEISTVDFWLKPNPYKNKLPKSRDSSRWPFKSMNIVFDISHAIWPKTDTAQQSTLIRRLYTNIWLLSLTRPCKTLEHLLTLASETDGNSFMRRFGNTPWRMSPIAVHQTVGLDNTSCATRFATGGYCIRCNACGNWLTYTMYTRPALTDSNRDNSVDTHVCG